MDTPAAFLDTAHMRTPPIAPRVGLGLALVLAACGGGKSTSDTDTATDATGGETSGTATTADPGSSGSTLASEPTSTSASTSSASSTATDPTTGGAAGGPPRDREAGAPRPAAGGGSALSIALRECTADFPEDAPIFRITLFQGVAVPVGEHKLDGGFGMAYLDNGDGTPVTGTTGTLTILAEVADGLVGTYDVTLSDDTHLAGSFDAVYCPQDVLCG